MERFFSIIEVTKMLETTDKYDLHFQDNMIFMKNCPDKHFELAIVDPNYGINATNNMNMGSAPNRNEPGQYPGVSTAVKVKGRLNSGGG